MSDSETTGSGTTGSGTRATDAVMEGSGTGVGADAGRVPRGLVRPATRADLPEIHAMVRELAAYEKAASHEVRSTEEQLGQALFGEHPAAFAHLAQTAQGETAGLAVWFLNFSTWRGRHGIHLEDLYVRPQHRGGGLGKALLTGLARICVERGYERLEWSVLDWNAPSIAFYESLGARPQDGWTGYRLTDEALALAGGARQ